MEQREDQAQRVDAAVETFELTRRFGAVTAVDAVSLRVHPAEIYGLIGPNGAGKTTLVKMLTTMLPPTSGTARVAGFDLATQAAEIRRRIGYVPQLLSADGELTGYENLLLSARLYLLPRAERDQRIADALALMGLTDVRDRLVRHYSGGMIRRLEIAQSTLHRPAIVFMDEPTEGLDPVGRHAVWNHIRDLRTRLGAAIIVTTHYMEEADALCDRIALIDRACIRAVGTPAALKAGVGLNATLDDVFEKLTGAADASDEYRDVRQARRAIREHG
jgi:ABC-2 type transport system ATP-binding protein